MKKIERRITGFIAKHPGCILRQIAEYLGQDPKKVRRVIDDMKERGMVV
jgi:DNA-binding MarR family transcriptional regulator